LYSFVLSCIVLISVDLPVFPTHDNATTYAIFNWDIKRVMDSFQ
jgi:hypothetical protein